MRALLLLVAFLISYGSLYPFQFAAHEGSVAELLGLLADLDIPTTRGDIVGNILLFLPYGIVGHLAAQHSPRPAFSGWVIALLGILLAVALQVAQVWLPARVPAIGDAIVNTVGLAIGFAIGALAGKRLLSLGLSADTAMLVPLTLLLLWLAYRWFPLVPTLDLQNVRNAVKPVFLSPQIDPTRIFHTAVAWFAWFLIAGATPLRRWPLWLLGTAALAATALQPFFVGNRLALNNLLGLAVALLALPLARRSHAAALACAGLLLALLLSGIAPYDFVSTPGRFEWLPFNGFLEGNMARNTLNLIEKCYLYGALLFLLQQNGSRPGAAAFTAALWLAVIEFLQLWVPGRTAEITDPLLALCLAFAFARSRSAVPARRGGGSTPRRRIA